MPKTERRTTLSLTKQQSRELDELCEEFEETASAVLRRAIAMLHYITFNKED